MIVYHGTTSIFDHFDLAQHYGQVVNGTTRWRDGEMEYKLPEGWNKALVIIGKNK
jgi:hypothetical protein